MFFSFSHHLFPDLAKLRMISSGSIDEIRVNDKVIDTEGKGIVEALIPKHVKVLAVKTTNKVN